MDVQLDNVDPTKTSATPAEALVKQDKEANVESQMHIQENETKINDQSKQHFHLKN